MAVATPLPTMAIAEEVTKEEAAKIDDLIEQLASTNDAKRLKDDGKSLHFPPDWDHKAQLKVEKAATSLVKLGRSAFPQLVARIGDERFSFINTSGNGAMSQQSVGDACGRIIQVQLEVFEQIGIYPRMYPSYFWTVVQGDAGRTDEANAKLKKWWDERKEKSLVELQIESFEWAIEQQTQLLDVWTKKNLRKKDRLQDLQEIISMNENTLRELRKTKRPIVPTVHPFKMYEGK